MGKVMQPKAQEAAVFVPTLGEFAAVPASRIALGRRSLLAAGLAMSLPGAARAEPAGTRLRDVLDRGQLRILTSLEMPALAYRDSAGQPAGFDVALGRLLAAGLGVEPVIQDVPMAERIARLRAGQGDIICHLPVTIEVARQALLTSPYGRIEISLISPARFPFRGMAELAGHPVGVLAGHDGQALAREMLPARARIEPMPNIQGLAAALAEGRVDAVVVARPVLGRLQRAEPRLGLSHRFVLAPRWIAVGVPFGEHDLLRVLNALIFLARSQGRLAALSEAHLGFPLPELPSF